MAITRALVDRARRVYNREDPNEPWAEGTPPGQQAFGPWVRVRFRRQSEEEGDNSVQVNEAGGLLIGLRDLDGNPTVVNGRFTHWDADDMVEIISAEGQHEYWNVSSGVRPLRRRKGYVGFRCSIAHAREATVEEEPLLPREPLPVLFEEPFDVDRSGEYEPPGWNAIFAYDPTLLVGGRYVSNPASGDTLIPSGVVMADVLITAEVIVSADTYVAAYFRMPEDTSAVGDAVAGTLYPDVNFSPGGVGIELWYFDGVDWTVFGDTFPPLPDGTPAWFRAWCKGREYVAEVWAHDPDGPGGHQPWARFELPLPNGLPIDTDDARGMAVDLWGGECEGFRFDALGTPPEPPMELLAGVAAEPEFPTVPEEFPG